MKNYDPYKKTILFIVSLINILLMTAIFAFVWYLHYHSMMYSVKFYRNGNYLITALYAIVLLFFSNMYGGLKIGQLRKAEVMLSQYLSLFLTNVVIYFVISLLSFRLVNPAMLLLMMVVEMFVSSFVNYIIINIYNRVFPPWKILLIYGNRPADNLVNKVETRRDKYAIYDAVNIYDGMGAVANKIKDFQAVIIGDISAVERNDILKYCYANKVRAYVVPKISDIILMGTDRIHVFDTPFMLSKGYTLSVDQLFAKRLLDILLVLPVIVIASPVMALAAVCIWLYDRGPVFYKQVRVTKHDKKFKIYKFRSMVVNAESDGLAKLAKENDDRITPVGRFIRATRIDELPQLFNILKGDMSFVGPRPERPEIIEEYCKEIPEFRFRTRVKAGLTGYAQVYGKYNTTPYDKLKLDLLYISSYSMWTDIKLILMTVKTMLKKEATEGVDDTWITAFKEDSSKNSNMEKQKNK